MSNKNVDVAKKSLADINKENINFYIDDYQRGYRWTEEEVTDLLKDILEFSQSNPGGDSYYCMQTLTVTYDAENNYWKVLDGQQRLTTIYLIYLYSCVHYNNDRIPFKISFSGRTNQKECMETLAGIKTKDSEQVEALLYTNGFKEDINCYYVISAYKAICDFFKPLDTMENDYKINDIFSIFNTKAKFIWYPQDDLSEEEETELFRTVNEGKIPLTNAELIKALLLLRKDGKVSSEQEHIAVMWDDIEAQLHEPDFWSFLVNERPGEKYTPKIDFIFTVMASEYNERLFKKYIDKNYYVNESANKKHYSFHVFYNLIKYLQETEKGRRLLGTKTTEEWIWEKVCEYFWMFKKWYYDRKTYHRVGYIIYSNKKKNNIETIRELANAYFYIGSDEKESDDSIITVHNGTTTHFLRYLNNRIRTELFKEEDVEAQKEEIKSLEYKGSQKETIVNVLLLYNLAKLEQVNDNSRFPFDDYKNKIKWDIEHINASAPDDCPKDLKDIKDWLENAVILTTDGDKCDEDSNKTFGEKAEELLALYNDSNEDRSSLNSQFRKLFDSVIERYKNMVGDNIGNLTLLNVEINRGYKNSVFPVKRNRIIEDLIKKDIFIPICTQNVFLKAFKGESDLLHWQDKDAQNYLKDMIDTIFPYIKEA